MYGLSSADVESNLESQGTRSVLPYSEFSPSSKQPYQTLFRYDRRTRDDRRSARILRDGWRVSGVAEAGRI